MKGEVIWSGSKTCSKCKETKPKSEFNRDRTRKDGLYPLCGDCSRAAKRLGRQPCSWCGGPKDPGRKRICDDCHSSGIVPCVQCGIRKPESDFYAHTGIRRSRICKSCHAFHNRDRRFNLPPGTVKRMFAAQSGKCQLCDNELADGDGRWAVDHDHSCCPGQVSCGACVRDLLCPKCNLGLGLFNDDPSLLRRAADYEDRWVMATAPPPELAEAYVYVTA